MYVNVDVKLVQERVRNDLFHPQNEISYIIIKIIKIYIKTPAIFLSFYVYLVQVKKDTWFENMGQLYIGQLLVSCFWLVVIGRLLFFGCFFWLLLVSCYCLAVIGRLVLFGCQCLAVIGQLLLFGCYCLAVIFWLIQSAVIRQLLLVCCYWSDVVGCYWSVVIGQLLLVGCFWVAVIGWMLMVSCHWSAVLVSCY